MKDIFSGITLLGSDLSRSIFIFNEKVGQASKLNKDEIEKLGMIYMG